MKKAAQSFIKICFLAVFTGCSHTDDTGKQQALENRRIDSLTEVSIDSAYRIIRQNCDTSLKYAAPLMADSISNMLLSEPEKFTDSMLVAVTKKMLGSADTLSESPNVVPAKAANIIALLKADCDSSLLKETYTQARLQLQLKRKQQHGKRTRRA